MMSVDGAVAAINSNGTKKGVLYITGGGLSALGMLSAHGGASNTLLSSRVCYAPKDSMEVFGCKPDHFVDPLAARQLAAAAFAHALRVRDDGQDPDDVFGVGCTSKLSVGVNEREGRVHAIYGAVMNSKVTYTMCIPNLEGGADRAFEERINALLILNLIGIGKGVGELVAVPLDGFTATTYSTYRPDIQVTSLHHLNHHPGVADVLTGKQGWCVYDSRDGGGNEGRMNLPGLVPSDRAPSVLFPGRFRPKHVAHIGMRRYAQTITGGDVGYEISLWNADKPPMDHRQIEESLHQFTDEECRVVLTRAPLFVDKARLFPGTTWVMGADTASRLMLPKYYGGMRGLFVMLEELEELGAKFLVFGRVDGSGEFRSLFSERWPHARIEQFWKDNALVVPETEFRVDMSSTQLRQAEA